MEKLKRHIRWNAIFMFLLLSGCALPTREPPPVAIPDHWFADVASGIGPPESWWIAFGDTQLKALLETMQRQNLEIEIAAERVRAAQITLSIAEASERPSVDISASVQHASSSTDDSEVVRAQHTLDLWGAARAQRFGAASALQAARAGREVSIWRLGTAAAQLYYERRALDERLTLAREGLAIAERTYARVQARYDAGVISGLDRALIQTAVESERSNVESVQLAGELARNAMSALVGQAPAAFIDPETPSLSLLDIEAPPLPLTLPTDVIAHRPDIFMLEAQLAGADADVMLARASLFPRIDIAATGAFSLESSNLVVITGVGLVQAIFDNGRRRAGVRLAESQYEQLLHAYHAGILGALVEIENSLVQAQRLMRREQLDRAVLDSAQHAYELSEIRYQSGLVDAITLLSAQNSFLRARDAVIQTRALYLQALVAVYAGVAPGHLQ